MLNYEMRQEQRLTQLQLQALKLLALGGAALDRLLQQAEVENPVFDMDRTPPPEQRLAAERGTGGWRLETAAWEERSLARYLGEQLPPRALTAAERRTFSRLVGCLDPDTGLLTEPAEEIARLLGAPLHTVEKCLSLLHQMEPAGVGAANLSESLILQAHRRGWTDPLLFAVLAEPLDELAARRYHRLAKRLHTSVSRIEECAERIRELNPRPLAEFLPHEPVYVIPDLSFVRTDGAWTVQIYDRWSGGVPYSEEGLAAMRGRSDPQTCAFWKQQRARADGIVYCLEQRRATLLRIGSCIAETQADFLSGSGALHALTQEEISARTGLAPSTVCRAFKDKFAEAGGRTYPLSFFLSRPGAGSAVKQPPSRSELLEAIRRCIENEDRSRPLSDEQIAAAVSGAGLRLSRRTAAKYRALLGIPGAYERKR